MHYAMRSSRYFCTILGPLQMPFLLQIEQQLTNFQHKTFKLIPLLNEPLQSNVSVIQGRRQLGQYASDGSDSILLNRIISNDNQVNQTFNID